MKKLAYWTVFVVLAASVGAYMAREPWGKYQNERAMAREAEIDMKKAEAERADLIRQKARYKSAAGREELLRDSGYTKQGELPVEKK